MILNKMSALFFLAPPWNHQIKKRTSTSAGTLAWNESVTRLDNPCIYYINSFLVSWLH